MAKGFSSKAVNSTTVRAPSNGLLPSLTRVLPIPDALPVIWFTDGSQSRTDMDDKGNLIQGGYGLCRVFYNPCNKDTCEIRSEGVIGVAYNNATSQRMELTAVIRAIELSPIGRNIVIVTDSQYCSKGINEWLPNWIRNGGKKNNRKGYGLVDIGNIDLWYRVVELLNVKAVDIHWVRGHTGNKYNERADVLSKIGRSISKIGWSKKKKDFEISLGNPSYVSEFYDKLGIEKDEDILNRK